MNARAEYERWLQNVDDDALLKEMQNLADAEIEERFGAYLAFWHRRLARRAGRGYQPHEQICGAPRFAGHRAHD